MEMEHFHNNNASALTWNLQKRVGVTGGRVALNIELLADYIYTIVCRTARDLSDQISPTGLPHIARRMCNEGTAEWDAAMILALAREIAAINPNDQGAVIRRETKKFRLKVLKKVQRKSA